ncbi:hypothetical protein [Microvirga antarctica]|uniref:hypothetical protein n=1 Tax=Microvirga antarctica TaxID=2819233 RepID=UPI001B300B15|nr:hypothetical protein [Microvirga antarctica]
MDHALTICAAVATGLAAVLGVKAATVTVRDDQDEFIGDLGRQGRWAAWAAVANAIAAALLILQTFRG